MQLGKGGDEAVPDHTKQQRMALLLAAACNVQSLSGLEMSMEMEWTPNNDDNAQNQCRFKSPSTAAAFKRVQELVQLCRGLCSTQRSSDSTVRLLPHAFVPRCFALS